MLSSSPELLGDLAAEHEHPSSSSSSLPVPATTSHNSFHLFSPSRTPDLSPSPAQVSGAAGEDTTLNSFKNVIIHHSLPLELGGAGGVRGDLGTKRCSFSQAVASPACSWGWGNERSNLAFPVPWLSPGSGWWHLEALKMPPAGSRG